MAVTLSVAATSETRDLSCPKAELRLSFGGWLEACLVAFNLNSDVERRKYFKIQITMTRLLCLRERPAHFRVLHIFKSFKSFLKSGFSDDDGGYVNINWKICISNIFCSLANFGDVGVMDGVMEMTHLGASKLNQFALNLWSSSSRGDFLNCTGACRRGWRLPEWHV